MCEFLHHLPEEHIYQTLHVKYRLAVSKLDDKKDGGKDLFMAAIKETQEVFKINKEIQREEAAMKVVAITPHQKTHRARQDQHSHGAGSSSSTKNQQQLSKFKNLCLNFNSPEGCTKGPQCSYYLHENPSTK